MSELTPLVRRRIPEWIRSRPPGGPEYARLKALLREKNLSTVCEEARCPNVHECWGGGTATVMLLGSVCTRGCKFCAVTSGNPGGKTDPDEPEELADAISSLGLTYVVVTMVDRDDLEDGGAGHVARSIAALRRRSPGLLVEVLVSDFQGNPRDVATVALARPDVFAHNVETVDRLQRTIRDARCSFARSLDVLDHAKRAAPALITKTSIMLGLGETDAEVDDALVRLRAVGVDIVTFGQYLRPTPWHLEVQDFVRPEKFDAWKARALALGFRYCASGPLVRSSYRAGELFLEGLLRNTRDHNPEKT